MKKKHATRRPKKIKKIQTTFIKHDLRMWGGKGLVGVVLGEFRNFPFSRNFWNVQ